MKTVVVTGASRGIGKALVQEFLKRGDFVVGTSRTGDDSIKHPNFVMVPMELTDPRSREACARMIVSFGKKIDVLINNAGIFHPKDEQVAVDVTTLQETLVANLYGPVVLSERLLAAMAHGGHIVNISSRRGSLDYTKEHFYPCYSISKAGLNMYTRKLAARERGRLIVSAVHPGFVRTDMNEGEGDISAEEAARHIVRLTHSGLETGQFWYEGKNFPW